MQWPDENNSQPRISQQRNRLNPPNSVYVSSCFLMFPHSPNSCLAKSRKSRKITENHGKSQIFFGPKTQEMEKDLIECVKCGRGLKSSHRGSDPQCCAMPTGWCSWGWGTIQEQPSHSTAKCGSTYLTSLSLGKCFLQSWQTCSFWTCFLCLF